MHADRTGRPGALALVGYVRPLVVALAVITGFLFGLVAGLAIAAAVIA